MRKMTEEQAKYFIKAGYFPKENETEAICDLQDVFGHLPYKFNLNLLADKDVEIRVNARKLFYIIWSKDTVEYYDQEAKRYLDALIAREDLLNSLKKQEEIISKFEYRKEEAQC